MNLREALRHQLNPEELAALVRSYDIVGDIAIIIIPEILVSKQKLIGDALIALNKRVKVVLKRSGIYRGEYRQIHLEVIAGENRMETICSENGVRLQLHLSDVYYSVRSSGERKRIASVVQEKERVLVMFSGVAPFPLVLGRMSKAAHIVGVEKNPKAHEYGMINLQLNKKIHNISLYQGDVREVLPAFGEVFDRIIMPLPEGSSSFLGLALDHLSLGGCLHYYAMHTREEFGIAISEISHVCKCAGRNLLQAEIQVAGHCGPGKYRICVDCTIV